jgi:hypothetical protein
MYVVVFYIHFYVPILPIEQLNVFSCEFFIKRIYNIYSYSGIYFYVHDFMFNC